MKIERGDMYKIDDTDTLAAEARHHFSALFHKRSKGETPAADCERTVSIPAWSEKEELPADFTIQKGIAAGFIYSPVGQHLGNAIALEVNQQFRVVAIQKVGSDQIQTPEGKPATAELTEKLYTLRRGMSANSQRLQNN